MVVDGWASISLRLGVDARGPAVDRRELVLLGRGIVFDGPGVDFVLRGTLSAGVAAVAVSVSISVVCPSGRSACSPCSAVGLLLLIPFSVNPLKSGLCALSYQQEYVSYNK